jgi:hypothetical protein
MGDAEFRRVGEVEVDNRRRVSLGRFGNVDHTRYFVEAAADGEIRLIPAVSIPAREMFVWQRPDVLASLRMGIAQAEAGKTHGMGDFTQYVDDKADTAE